MSVEAEIKTLAALVSAQDAVMAELMQLIPTIGVSAGAWDRTAASSALASFARRLNDIASNRTPKPDAEFLLYYADKATSIARLIGSEHRRSD